MYTILFQFSWYHVPTMSDLSTMSVSGVSLAINSSYVGKEMSTVTIRGVTYDFIGGVMCVTTESGMQYTDSNSLDVIGN